jgi:hypothetical protein
MARLTKQTKQKQFIKNAYIRADKCNYRCQNCGVEIHLTGNWIQDCFHFDHIKSRSKCNDNEYVNYFLFVCKNLHIYKHDAPKKLELDPCVSLFLANYYNDGLGHFYKKFIEINGLRGLHLDYE